MIVSQRIFMFFLLLHIAWARFSIVNQTTVASKPFYINSAQTTANSLYIFANKDFKSTFLIIDAVTLCMKKSFTIDGFLTFSLPPFYDLSNGTIYLIYKLYQESNFRISSISMNDLSVGVNQTFDVSFEPGEGLLNSYTKSIYVPEEDMPLGNQLRQITINGFNDTGKIIDLDIYGVVLKRHQNPMNPYLYTVQHKIGSDQMIVAVNIVQYNLERYQIEKIWNTTEKNMFAYSSCFIPGVNMLALGIGGDSSPIGVSIFDLYQFKIIGTLLLDPSLKQKGYPTRLTSNGNYVYFTTSNQEITQRQCLVWRVPVKQFDTAHLEYITTPQEKICNVIMLESNERGAYFATDLGQHLFSTN